jgi:hypothetical protein
MHEMPICNVFWFSGKAQKEIEAPKTGPGKGDRLDLAPWHTVCIPVSP